MTASADKLPLDGPFSPAGGTLRDPTVCAHCGLPVPAPRRESGFCCAGCEAVWGILHGENLERFYALGGAAGAPVGAVPASGQWDWLPDLESQGRLDDSVVRLVLDVQGIRCAACVWLLQEVWRRLPGALDIALDPSVGRVRLTYDRRQLTLVDFLERAARLGYPMAPASRRPERGDRDLLIRLGVCSALAGNAMLLALSMYLGLEQAGGLLREVFRWASFGFATASVLVGGPVFFRAALAGLRQRVLHLDLPISLGIVLAYAGSAWGMLASGGAVYFDTITIFVALMLGGRYLQARTLARNRHQVLADDGAEHLRARRLTGRGVDPVPVRALRAGDELLLAPGDLVPVTVEVLAEQSAFSLDWINGESKPRQFLRGVTVPAGAFHCGTGAVRVRALDDFQGSGLADLLRSPQEDREDPRSRGRFWANLNRSYVAAVLVLALAGGLLWAFLDSAMALPVAISVLVVTCPCALGLATPLAFHLVLARLRRRGIFVRSGALLEKARHVRKVVFDKTGTLTWGGLRVQALREPEASDRDVLLTMAASSGHPVSRAILKAQGAGGFRFLEHLPVRELPGKGLLAEHDGRAYRLGSRSLVLEQRDAPDFEGSLCLFSRDGDVAAAFRIDEDYREGAVEELAALRQRAIDVHLVSGDRKDRVARAARHLGLPDAAVHGDMSPDDKEAFVAGLDADDTMMVGDGLNDAQAFGRAFCAGTPAMDRPVMPARADFFFVGAQGGAVRAVLDAAGLMHRTVRANLWLAGVYNGAALTLCFFGVMTPLLCAVLMPLSSVALVTHTGLRIGGGRAA